jgi:hypothetical protein
LERIILLNRFKIIYFRPGARAGSGFSEGDLPDNKANIRPVGIN